MKRILIVCPAQGPGGGAQIVLDEMLQGWTERSIELVLLSPPGSLVAQTAMARGISWIPFNGSLIMSRNLDEMRRTSKRIPPVDAIYAWTIRVFPAVRWLARARTLPAGGTLHDSANPSDIRGDVLWAIRGGAGQSWKKALWNTGEYTVRTLWRWLWARHAARDFQQLVCVSQAVKESCERMNYQCPLSVIHNGLADVAQSRKMRGEPLRLGYLGVSQPQRKGFGIVESWVAKTGRDYQWEFYGEARPEIAARIERLKRNHSVYHHGFTNRETIFSTIDVLIHASNLFDPLPTVLIEAARSGIPSIASSRGGAAEIVDDGKSGFLFNPGRPEEGIDMLSQLRNWRQREAMGVRGREIYETRFRIGMMVSRYENLFHQLSERNTGSA
jgi:glycosyltransferase involved in cell wall biosynthesis